MDLLHTEVPASRLVVAIDPGKAFHRVWLSTGERGLIGKPVSLPVLKDGFEQMAGLIKASGVEGGPVIGIEATGALHRPWAAAIEDRWPDSLRLFAPSETTAARAQLGFRRFKTDDRDCAALTWLIRQGAGRAFQPDTLEAMLAAVRHRRALVDARRRLSQRLHDQLNALCPGLSAPAGQGRALAIESSTGQAVLACACAFAGRAPQKRSLLARSPGRMGSAQADYWVDRWHRLLPPPADARQRARHLERELERFRQLQQDIGAVEVELEELLKQGPGQILTGLPGVATNRAAAFCAHTLPIERWPSAGHLYSATGLAPASYESSTISRRGRISRQGLAEHRDALMGIAQGLAQNSPSFAERDRELRARGFRPIQARVAIARSACRLCWRILKTQQPFDERRYAIARQRGR